MTRLSPRHPRYHSLVVRARLAAAARSGLVVPEGLIAHGRGEAFDYFLGERSSRSALRAERAAAHWLLAARWPVLSINGNVAALAAGEVAGLQRALPNLRVEVNLFHRTPSRVRAVALALRSAGVPRVLGVNARGRLPRLPSDRARIDLRGIARADVCLVPLEDGDRAEALHRRGQRVIAIDLNPLSRTAVVADLPIVDELRRALVQITREVRRDGGRTRPGWFDPVDAPRLLREARRAMADRLRSGTRELASGARASRRPARGSGRPRRRTPGPRSRRRRSPR
jgi:4-phosphopantoate---beta-alanine ligase